MLKYSIAALALVATSTFALADPNNGGPGGGAGGAAMGHSGSMSGGATKGVVVPRSVHIYPVPGDIVTIVPDYSGYEYFMIDEAHLAIVDPDRLEVVDIIVIA